MTGGGDGGAPEGVEVGGLAGVLVWTEAARFPAMARFYREVLGLHPRTVRPDFINFDWGGLRLSIGVHQGVRGPATDPLRLMLNFRVGDIEGAAARLRAAGVVFTRPPEAEPWGGRVATFADPDGNVLQLLELGPGLTGRRPA